MIKMQNLYEENLSYKKKEYTQKEKQLFKGGKERVVVRRYVV